MVVLGMIVLDMRKIVFTAVLLAMSLPLVAKQKPAAQPLQPSADEQVMLQRIYQTQSSGSDSDFYEAYEAYMSYVEGRKEWDKYYRTWMNRVIYEINHKRFHRAYSEIHHLTDDVKWRHHEQYLYMANMGLGFF